jgi:flavin-dependent dehydrogenase
MAELLLEGISMRRLAEVAIVGAGAAGARAAELLARRGVEVLLVDPKAPWEKPCGGGLTSTLLDEVPELEEIAHLARPVRVARVELANGAAVEVDLERPMCMVAREDLGRWQLQRAVRAGAEHVPAHVREITRTEGGWLLDTDLGRVQGETLVGADGAASIVRRATGCGLRMDLLAARVEYPPLDVEESDALVLRFYPGVVGYLWDFPRLHHRSVGMEVASRGASRSVVDAALDEYLQRDPWSQGDRHGAVIGTAPLRAGRFSRLAGKGFALVGDAAGLADPFTGEGIRNAFRSAALLARIYDRNRPGWPRAYAAAARREFATDLAAASLLRRTLADTGTGVALVEWASRSMSGYAVVAAILDALAEHDYRLGAFVRRYWARRSGTRRPLPAQGGRRGGVASAHGDRT